jgi:RPA family protein
MSNENGFQKRQTAYWMEIKDLLGGCFIKNDDGSSSYQTNTGFMISRVNIFGIVLSKEANEFFEGIFMEDGSGNISVKSFDKKGIFENIEVGDTVNIIGKIREYNQTPFVSAEIVTKRDNRELLLRKKELAAVRKFYKREEPQKTEEVVVCDSGARVVELIKGLDNGDGADMDLLAQKCKIKDVDKIIEDLIRSGDVFEIRPGKLKVLD